MTVSSSTEFKLSVTLLTELKLFECLLNAFAALSLLAYLLVEQVADVDVLPVEVLCDLRRSLALRRAWHADEENSPHYNKNQG